jgi:hypothetical protein
MVAPIRTTTAILLLASLTAPLAAQAFDYRFDIDVAQSQVAVSISSTLGTINVSPSSVGMDGTLEVHVQHGFIGNTDITITDGFLYTVPSTINATIPNPLPFLPPLATATVHDLQATISAPQVTVGANGVLSLDPSMTSTGGTVTMGGLFGSGTEPVYGIPSSPVTVPGSYTPLANNMIELRIDLNMTMTIVLDPVLGTTADVTLIGPVIAIADANQPNPMRLEGPRPLTAGTPANFTVHNVPSNQAVFLGASLAGLGNTFIAPLGIAVSMVNPIQVGGPVLPNGAGTASFSANVPASVSGRSVLVQAVTSGEASNLVGTWVL